MNLAKRAEKVEFYKLLSIRSNKGLSPPAYQPANSFGETRQSTELSQRNNGESAYEKGAFDAFSALFLGKSPTLPSASEAELTNAEPGD
jgi:hypothetical protein